MYMLLIARQMDAAWEPWGTLYRHFYLFTLSLKFEADFEESIFCQIYIEVR